MEFSSPKGRERIGTGFKSGVKLMSPIVHTKTIYLHDWWLMRVGEGGDGISVGGFTTRREGVETAFYSASIKERRDSSTLESSDGFTIFISGLINRSVSEQNGFPPEVCSHFLTGFPYNWDDFSSQHTREGSTHVDYHTCLPDGNYSSHGLYEEAAITEHISNDLLAKLKSAAVKSTDALDATPASARSSRSQNENPAGDQREPIGNPTGDHRELNQEPDRELNQEPGQGLHQESHLEPGQEPDYEPDREPPQEPDQESFQVPDQESHQESTGNPAGAHRESTGSPAGAHREAIGKPTGTRQSPNESAAFKDSTTTKGVPKTHIQPRRSTRLGKGTTTTNPPTQPLVQALTAQRKAHRTSLGLAMMSAPWLGGVEPMEAPWTT